MHHVTSNNWNIESGDTFDEFTYEDEDLNKAEEYYTLELSEEDFNIYDNLWKDEVSSAIYLTIVEELPTQEREKETLTEKRNWKD
ncbi:9700_t:CDS:2 [Scutellospora calospora]|uniref:9700_t:CDS:1 n=1 Tax=Scutellospora calospora TaxID=85575 RepID=A0ACA9K3T9_9GLOM|nr:9700_t:CDS:2 [Scutellospora calospora]